MAIGSDRKSTRLNSSHVEISYAVFCLKKKKKKTYTIKIKIKNKKKKLKIIINYIIIFFNFFLSSVVFFPFILFAVFFFVFFFFNDTATTEIYTLSLHDALPICQNYRFLPLIAELAWRVAAG